MDEAPRLLAADPPRPGTDTRPSSVIADLVRHERALQCHPRSPLLDLLATAERELTPRQLGLDPSLAESLEPVLDSGVRIELSGEHSRNTGPDECVHTVESCRDGAGLERDVDRGSRARAPAAASATTSACGPPLRSCQPSPTISPSAITTGTHDGAPMSRPSPLLRELERALQEPRIHRLILRPGSTQPGHEELRRCRGRAAAFGGTRVAADAGTGATRPRARRVDLDPDASTTSSDSSALTVHTE